MSRYIDVDELLENMRRHRQHSVPFEYIKSLTPAHVAPVPKWISVYDSTPAYDTDVLVYTITGEKCVASSYPCYETEDFKNVFYANEKQLDVTHWMPLPEPPKEVE